MRRRRTPAAGAAWMGLFAGLLIARIGLGLAGYIFGIFGDTLMDGIANPVAGLVIVVIMAFALVALARFAFSMIYTVPDWAQRLVGAHEMGEGMQEQSLRSAVSGLSSELRSFSNSWKRQTSCERVTNRCPGDTPELYPQRSR